MSMWSQFQIDTYSIYSTDFNKDYSDFNLKFEDFAGKEVKVHRATFVILKKM